MDEREGATTERRHPRARRRALRTRVLAAAAGVLVLVSTVAVAYRMGQLAPAASTVAGAASPSGPVLPPGLSSVGDLYARLRADAVDVPSDEELIEGALTGMLETLDDDYAVYYDAEAFSAFNQQLDGEFSGVGMVLEEVPEGLTVVTVLPGTPAEQAGIRSGQRIVTVDGRDVTGLPIESVVEIVKGEEGTDVRLGLQGQGPTEVTLTRAVIALPTSESELRDDGLGYIRLLQFSQRSSAEVREAVADLEARGAQGLILDLRGNPGGLLQEAIDVTSVFADEGVVVRVEERDAPPQDYPVNGNAATELPLVVVVDGGSASASEIVAAALKDLGRASVVGETTFGKGTVQTVRLLGDGSGVKFTTARYLTPTGGSIEGVGVTPDRVVVEDEAQIETAADLLRQDLAGRLSGEVAAVGGR